MTWWLALPQPPLSRSGGRRFSVVSRSFCCTPRPSITASVRPGSGAGVVIIPGFLGSDTAPYYSGSGLNADCPNLLIRHRLNETIDRARRETRRKVRLLGHSLGGLLAPAAAPERPRDVSSVITLASPFPAPSSIQA